MYIFSPDAAGKYAVAAISKRDGKGTEKTYTYLGRIIDRNAGIYKTIKEACSRLILSRISLVRCQLRSLQRMHAKRKTEKISGRREKTVQSTLVTAFF